jgi:DUF971 family protein
MIKVIEAKYRGNYEIALVFSDGYEGIFDAKAMLKRQGPLLDALRQEDYFKRFFIDAGALCWPNGLELSPTKLHDSCVLETA